MISYHTYKHLAKDIPMPFAFVNLDLFNKNIQSVLSRSENLNIRIASKSVRSVPMLQHILSSNKRFIGIMAFHPLEAVALAEEGFSDILIGYPCVNEFYIKEILHAAKPIVIMVDSIAQLQIIHQTAKKFNQIADVCLDIDMSTDYPGLHFGVWRSSISTASQAVDIYRWIQQHEHIRLRGVMGYEAQIAGVGNKIKGQFLKSHIISMLQNQSKKSVAKRRESVVKGLQDAGAELAIVNAGGTGSIESSVLEPWVTEVTVGSAFYAPALFDNYQHFRHEPAAGFALEITRIPHPGIYTCHGGGYIASGQIDKLKQPVPFLPIGIQPTSNEGFGEVQTPLHYNGSEQLHIGDPIFFRHAKAGELMEHFNQLYLFEQDQLIKAVASYRGMGWSFG